MLHDGKVKTEAPEEEAETAVTFPDSHLDSAVRNRINIPSGPIYPSDLESVTSLHLSSTPINSLEGLEYFINLEQLEAQWYGFSDLSPLANLSNLKEIHVHHNNISDISSLAGLTNLEKLQLSHNNISDISPLLDNAGLPSGDQLWLDGLSLTRLSRNVHILTLRARGVTVSASR